MRVVIVGGGVAGAEALLALRELAGARVHLTMVSDRPELVLPALSVGEPFARSHALRRPLQELTRYAGAELIGDRVREVDPTRRTIMLEEQGEVHFDALVLAPGARAVERIAGATTWWPDGRDDMSFSGLLRDLEEGYSKRVAFVIPAGPVWPLPLYELALMTAGEVQSMGIDDAELTVITPEAAPLSLFGEAAGHALQAELRSAKVGLETRTVIRLEKGHRTQLILQPSTRRLGVDRVVALPGVVGPAIRGADQDSRGFIRVDRQGRMESSDCVWAAGDGVVSALKHGAVAAQQADMVAAEVAAIAGAAVRRPAPPRLQGILLTGRGPRRLPSGALKNAGTSEQSEQGRPTNSLWRATGKVFGVYLTPFLLGAAAADEHRHLAADAFAPDGAAWPVEVDRVLPAGVMA